MGRFVRTGVVLLAALIPVSFPPGAIPAARADIEVQQVGSVPIPDGPAQGWVVADLDTGQVLAARNENTHYAPASTIKTLLAQVVLDEVPLDTTIVAEEADTKVECNCAGVTPGQTYTARQLLEAALLVSGNDAANTLARMLGGPEAAVTKMNAKAAALGAHGTNVASPSGLDGPGMPFWSTPHDMAAIFRGAMANPAFAQITAMPSTVFPTKSGDRVLVNQDELLQRYPGAIGGKTGYTDIAHKTFVGAAQRGDRRLLVAMMYGLVKEGGPTYWDQASTLLDWGFTQDRSASVGSL
ncbi:MULTISPECIES: D-alanyl-D-alanine carboxypeptidase family protein [unclassified Mycolicibacterium]|uniref:D-alanyl-D-alanine carboxypeptidase family protein n=1 Tax=unclassified Mycolicibacterium TaxID=2636767 RepID=UPI0012DEEE7D|nr:MULTISPECIES: serine hydrolase [unclassified Mycolicibacterium]MUL80547.1 D-alanyl-D-alanine carboxypeptidase [Mycolicibacterium sp. CBMA 329]MUL86314.1 D-alanyl-D-alanine carboxypeptidase [Mycolicibacterium sp. CBMA 331]MUM01025.1 D-alanyl-D-alanine carboxypeptidase [Mycolicibacterium sp. CBMA 334]MUM30041.1 D-alanyl-D-alanine carboxypeptidase [Mycolicibacterium sp. CBMA 295]MUM36610.1 D-alanyl-D-alanine carboxypeptidase [Mycolicibacterium sp. CBMA 247]